MRETHVCVGNARRMTTNSGTQINARAKRFSKKFDLYERLNANGTDTLTAPAPLLKNKTVSVAKILSDRAVDSSQ
jgi:hypothetical protein